MMTRDEELLAKAKEEFDQVESMTWQYALKNTDTDLPEWLQAPWWWTPSHREARDRLAILNRNRKGSNVPPAILVKRKVFFGKAVELDGTEVD
jgi:hypothetical protein